MSRPGPISAKPLAAIVGRTIDDVFAKQGFASRELITRWREIAGAEIAEHSQPLKIQWPRPVADRPPDPATLVLRVEGPMALEIQHQSTIILERVNRYFGFGAIERIAIRQAPLRPLEKKPLRTLDLSAVQAVADTLPEVDENLKMALARLGAAVKRK